MKSHVGISSRGKKTEQEKKKTGKFWDDEKMRRSKAEQIGLIEIDLVKTQVT